MAIVSKDNNLNLEGRCLGYLTLFIRLSHEVLQVVLVLDHSDLIARLPIFPIAHTHGLISIL